MTKKIVLCTLRDNKGATGGPGGVLYMLSQLLGEDIDGIPCEFRFNSVAFGRRFKGWLNRIFFRLRCKMEGNAFYVAHDIEAGAILASLGKPYSLVYHNQGPIVQEKVNFGRVISGNQLKYWKSTERNAFTGAKTLHFPSSGAANMFFDNVYASCNREEVSLGVPLYNTIPNEKPKDVEGLKRKDDTLTFFSLGTMTEAKGQDQAIQFVESYIEKNVGKKVRYIIVGRGPLQQQVCSKGEEMMQHYSNFEFVYFNSLEHSQVAYVHEIADVYLMLHRLSIFDFATLEAMLAKTAVVLSPVGGNVDFDKKENVIFASGDYSEAISRLTSDEIDRQKQLNHDTFQQYFSSVAFAEAYRQMIRKNIAK